MTTRIATLLVLFAWLAALAACSSKASQSNKRSAAEETGAETPEPPPAEPPADVSAFVPASDSVEITGTNLRAGELVAAFEVMGADYKFTRVGNEVPYDPATRVVTFNGVVPRSFGATTPLRVLILDAASKAVRLCSDGYVSAAAIVVTHASNAGCALLDLLVTSDAGRALLPVADLSTLGELGQVMRASGTSGDSALVNEVVASYVKVRTAQREAQGTTVQQESDRLAVEAAAATVAATRELVDSGKYSEIAPGRVSATSAVVRDVAATSATNGASDLALAYAAIAIKASTGTVVTLDQVAAAGVEPGALVTAVDGTLGGGDPAALQAIAAKAAMAPAGDPTAPTPPPTPRDFTLTPLDGGQLRLTWTAPAAGHRVVLMHRNGAPVTFALVDGTSYEMQVGATVAPGERIRHAGAHVPSVAHTNLVDGEVQHYALWLYDPATGRYSRVPARVSGGPIDSTPPSGFGLAAPGMTATSRTPQILWTSSAGADTYDVRIRQTTCAGAILHNVEGLQVLTYTFTALLDDGATYCFEVVARDKAGNVASTSVVSTVTLARPGTPGTLSATPGNARVTLGWDGSTSLRYLLVRRTGAAVNVAPADGTDYGMSPINDGNGNVSLHTGLPVAAFDDLGLANGSTFHYALWAYDPTTLKYSLMPTRASATTNANAVFHLALADAGTIRYATGTTAGGWVLSTVNAGATAAVTLDAADRPTMTVLLNMPMYDAAFTRLESSSWTAPTTFRNGIQHINFSLLNNGDFRFLHSGVSYNLAETVKTGAVFSAPTDVHDPASVPQPMTEPVMLTAANGDVHAVWRRPGMTIASVVYARFNGATWGDFAVWNDDATASQCLTVAGLDLALDTNGNPHVVYRCGGAPNRLVYARKPAGTWIRHNVGPLTTCAEENAILGIGADSVYIAYSDGGDCDLLVRQWTNGSDVGGANLDAGPGASITPRMTLDRDGTTHIFYIQTDQGATREIRQVSRSGMSMWTPPLQRLVNLGNSSSLGRGVGVTGMFHESRPR